MPEVEHLAGHGTLHAVHARNAVTDRDHGADFGHVDLDGKAANLLANDLGDFFSSDIHSSSLTCGDARPCQSCRSAIRRDRVL